MEPTGIINDEIAAAMRLARKLSHLTPVQFARELNRLARLPGTGLTGDMVEMIEAGEMAVLADYLVAAARIAGQPTSAILGEMDLYEVTLPRLEARIAALEARQLS